MLKVKSFPITDDAGINALLVKCRLATGAHILVSDGHVCIPYEDGEPDPLALRIVGIREQQNILIKQREIIEHSQAVIKFLMMDCADRLKVAEANHMKNKSNKALEAKYQEAEAALNELEAQQRSNKHEIVRFDINLEEFHKQVAALEK